MSGRQVASSASFRNLKVTGNLAFSDGSIASVINDDTSFTPLVTPGGLVSNVTNIAGPHHSKVGTMNRYVFAFDGDVAAGGGIATILFTLPISSTIVPGSIRGMISTILPTTGVYNGPVKSGSDADAFLYFPASQGAENGANFIVEVTWTSTE